MIDHRCPVSELSDCVFLLKSAFIVDLTTHINGVNLKLQGENSVIFDLHIKAFRTKIKFLEKHLASLNFDHFETCNSFSADNKRTFPKD